MKKLLTVVLSLMVLILFACSNNNDSSNNATNNTDGNNDSEDIQEITVKFTYANAENTPKHIAATAMKELIESESNGNITFELYPNSTLFGDEDEFQNLVANNAQFIAPDLPKLSGTNPQFNVPNLPFAFDNESAAIGFWDGEKGQEIMSSLEDEGILGLYMWPNGGKHVTNSKKPLESPEDFDGLIFRIQGGEVLNKIYSSMGAGSESIAFSELYTSLDQGVIDGQENIFSNIEAAKLDEVQEYMTVLDHTRVDYALFTNTTFWDSLNEPTKAIIEKGIEKGTEVAREEAEKVNAKAFETLKERGNMEITELTPEQVQVFRDKFEPIFDEYEDVIGADVYDAIEQANEKYGDS